jgi:hypothetical protein
MLALWNFAVGLAAHLLVPPAIQGSPSCAHTRRVGENPSGAATVGSDWASSGAERALSRPAGDAQAHRSRPQSQGGFQPPRSNGRAFDEARNPVTVAGRRRYKASVPAHPCWDQAVPSCSPLTGWAPGPVAASRPSRLAAALSYLTEGGRVRPGSADWP